MINFLILATFFASTAFAGKPYERSKFTTGPHLHLGLKSGAKQVRLNWDQLDRLKMEIKCLERQLNGERNADEKEKIENKITLLRGQLFSALHTLSMNEADVIYVE